MAAESAREEQSGSKFATSTIQKILQILKSCNPCKKFTPLSQIVSCAIPPTN